MPDVWAGQPLAIRQSTDQLATWAPQLRLFRYCRAYGGHANDGDQLQVALRADSPDDVQQVLTELGVGPIDGQSGWTTLVGEPVFVWIADGRVELSCSDGYDVTKDTFERVLRIEPAVEVLVDRVIEPPLDNSRCFCPKFYPDVLW